MVKCGDFEPFSVDDAPGAFNSLDKSFRIERSKMFLYKTGMTRL
ncbi:2153_t:CDS:1, partial [Acaulospora colombiana]